MHKGAAQFQAAEHVMMELQEKEIQQVHPLGTTGAQGKSRIVYYETTIKLIRDDSPLLSQTFFARLLPWRSKIERSAPKIEPN